MFVEFSFEINGPHEEQKAVYQMIVQWISGLNDDGTIANLSFNDGGSGD